MQAPEQEEDNESILPLEEGYNGDVHKEDDNENDGKEEDNIPDSFLWLKSLKRSTSSS